MLGGNNNTHVLVLQLHKLHEYTVHTTAVVIYTLFVLSLVHCTFPSLALQILKLHLVIRCLDV